MYGSTFLNNTNSRSRVWFTVLNVTCWEGDSVGKAVIQFSCDQVIIPWWQKLNNVSLFLDLSNIKFTSQVQEYNHTDEAIPIDVLGYFEAGYQYVK